MLLLDGKYPVYSYLLLILVTPLHWVECQEGSNVVSLTSKETGYVLNLQFESEMMKSEWTAYFQEHAAHYAH